MTLERPGWGHRGQAEDRQGTLCDTGQDWCGNPWPGVPSELPREGKSVSGAMVHSGGGFFFFPRVWFFFSPARFPLAAASGEEMELWGGIWELLWKCRGLLPKIGPALVPRGARGRRRSLRAEERDRNHRNSLWVKGVPQFPAQGCPGLDGAATGDTGWWQKGTAGNQSQTPREKRMQGWGAGQGCSSVTPASRTQGWRGGDQHWGSHRHWRGHRWGTCPVGRTLNQEGKPRQCPTPPEMSRCKERSGG